MKRAKFIINPTSGKQNFLKEIESLIGCLIMNRLVNHVDVFYTKKQFDARNEAKKLKEGEYDFVTAIGGDGTLNEVINGVYESGSQIPVAVISAGTVNDFATFMHLPHGIDEFCRMIREFKTKEIDIGRINNEYFINVVAGGLWADVAYKVPKESKAVLGKMAYYVEGALDVPKQGFKTIKLSFECEEYTSKNEDVLLFIVTNSGSVGGFRKLVPNASVNDGLFDVIIFKKMDFGQFSSLAFKFMQGEHLKHECIQYFQTKRLTISCADKGGIPIDYDGEMFGELPVCLEMIPKAVKLLML